MSVISAFYFSWVIWFLLFEANYLYVFVKFYGVWSIFFVFIVLSKRQTMLTAVFALIFIPLETLCVYVMNKTCIVKIVDILDSTKEKSFWTKLVLTAMYFWAFSLLFWVKELLMSINRRENEVSFMIKASRLLKETNVVTIVLL